MSRIVVLTADVLAPQMAGPAIRALAIGAALAADRLADGARHEVLLVSTAACELVDSPCPAAYVPADQLRARIAGADVVVVQGFATYHHPWLLTGDAVLIVDLYDPVLLEQLEQMTGRPALARRSTHDRTVRTFNDALVRGDFFLCANEEQRHFWLGQLAALGRLGPENYDRDPALRSLLAVVPFGLPAEPPTAGGPALRGVIPGVGAADRVVLWAGGVYNWLDPLTLVRAVAALRDRHPDLRLVFLGMRHPNPQVPEMRVAAELRVLADELGLTGSTVIFNEGWVPYERRGAYLLEADVGVSTHLLHVETTFSFRTRMLDYLWAGLPIVATEGDGFARLIEHQQLGVVVPERDVIALAAALERCAYDKPFAAAARIAVARVAADFTWERALAPLVAFCRSPRRAADDGPARERIAGRLRNPATTAGREALRARELWQQGGPGLVVERLRSRRDRLRRG